MIYLRLSLSEKQSNKYFLEYLKEGISTLLQELFTRKSKRELINLSDNLSILNSRYKSNITVSKYISTVINSLSYDMSNYTIVIQLSTNSNYYRLIKSIELGSYKIVAIPMIGKVLDMLPNLIDKFYTDYEVLVQKLSYYKTVDSIKYKILTKQSIYKLSDKLNNRVKLINRIY